MNIRRSVVAVLLASPLVLAACSSDDDPAPATAGAEATSASAPEIQTANIGEPMKMECFTDEACDVDVIITDAQLTDACPHGDNGYTEYALADDETNLVLSGEIHVNVDEGNGWEMAPDPQIIDGEGFTQTVGSSAFCDRDYDVSGWTDPVDAGEKARIEGIYVVPADAQVMKIDEYQIDISGLRSTGASGPAPTEANQAEEPAPASGSSESGGFESGGNADAPVVPNPDVPGANESQPGESSSWVMEDGTTGGMTVDADGNTTYY